MEILLGADPELFVVDNESQKMVSAHDLIPGTKHNPYMVHFGAVQVDGVAAEFNIQPAKNEDDFVLYLNTVKNRMEEMIQENNPSYHLSAQPVALFDQDYFDSLPMIAKLLGCEPDYNAYTGKKNTPPSTDRPFRTGSGHIHIGFTSHEDPKDDDHFALCCEIVKQIDSVIYPASHIWDQDMDRRTLYGSRGSFRPKSYGVEYRPLSNAWLNSEDTMRFVYRQVFGAVDLLLNKGMKVYG